MEPFSALAVATATCQFLDFTSNIVSGTWRIYNTKSGHDSARNAHVRTITEDLIRLNCDIHDLVQQQSSTTLSAGDEAILELGEKCNEVAHRLVDAVNRLQKKPRISRAREAWDSFRVALRTIWDENSINALIADLQSYRQQIALQILVSQRELTVTTGREQKQIGQAHTRAIEDNTGLSHEILARMDKHSGDIKFLAATIQNSYSHGAAGIMTAVPASKICDVLQKTDTTDASKMILHQLHFRELSFRYERVAIAHGKTFEWIFRAPLESDGWANFTDWLESDGDALYWITGKPGAGKSTLMRFILDNSKTSIMLDRWAGTKQLLKISFFFWNSGSELQMSYEGLVRSLLYQILEQLPQLVLTTFPHRVLDSLLFGTFLSDRQDWNWTWDELMIALRTLLQECTKCHKIMIFIDGMDEFMGKPSALIEFIRGLIVPGIKICASSRPWNQFEDAFGRGPHLRIERLTLNDIESFVASELASSVAFIDYEQSQPGFSAQIVSNVCQKSEGVFLWVRLATNSLLEGLEGGESPPALQVRLNGLPPDLENLFDKILNGLDDWHSEQASHLFQLHCSSIQPLTLLDMCFATGESSKEAIEGECIITEEQANARCRLMHRRINACTKGLLEAGNRDDDQIANIEIRFLHRTVKDYLEGPIVWERICSMSQETFDSDYCLFKCHLERLNAGLPSGSMRNLSKFQKDALFATEYVLRNKNSNAEPRTQLLRKLDSAYALRPECPHLDLDAARTRYTYFPKDAALVDFVRVAVNCDLFKYVQESLKSTAGHGRVLMASEILRAAFSGVDHSPQDTWIPRELPHLRRLHPSVRFIRFLLECGADPNNGAWKELLIHVVSRRSWHKAYSIDNPEVLAIIEEMLKFKADPRDPNLKEILQRTKQDTTAIRAIMKKNRQEETWTQKSSYYLSRYGSKLRVQR